MVFHKERADAPVDFFAAEAAGLRWLGAAGAPVVEVIDVGNTTLISNNSTPPDLRLPPRDPSVPRWPACTMPVPRISAARRTASADRCTSVRSR
ncbi:hypothetical protein GCM10027169_20300 [Gordonia jinhuaensis]|uniref:Uncharacterized protein n=1 Tax=Gordonia jinhuaensis TaxID=1517702 RepID=A0A916TI12_9ACTN|nr:hypothetical protein GCM10011489_34440 [Gordonia jinhuaensis]